MKKKILFMEDEDIIREVLSEYLKVASYEVTEARDGKEALDLLENNSFDLSILDIMVPEISGLDLLSYIEDKKIDMAIIILTALSDEASQLTAFNRKADDFIVKPVSPIILLKRVEAILRRCEKKDNSKISNDLKEDLQLDENTYRAFYNERDLELTVSEFLILNALYKKKTMVFSRKMLIDIVFGEDYVCTDRIIDTHIKNLRKKLPVDCIKTVIGLGYIYKEF